MSPSRNPRNPTGKKHKFNKAWMQEHVSDHFVQEAQRLGYRSRAAFKLIELVDKDKLLRSGHDGGRPGRGARQLVPGAARAAGRLGARSSPSICCRWTRSPASIFIQGDFRDDAALSALVGALGGRKADLVLSDLAPN